MDQSLVPQHGAPSSPPSLPPHDDFLQISYNWCDADDAVFAIYYLDNGSSRWDVYQNVGSNSPLPWCYFMTGGGGPSGKASNSSVSELWCQDTSPGRNDCADLGCTVDEKTVLCVAAARPPALCILTLCSALCILTLWSSLCILTLCSALCILTLCSALCILTLCSAFCILTLCSALCILTLCSAT